MDHFTSFPIVTSVDSVDLRDFLERNTCKMRLNSIEYSTMLFWQDNAEKAVLILFTGSSIIPYVKELSDEAVIFYLSGKKIQFESGKRRIGAKE